MILNLCSRRLLQSVISRTLKHILKHQFKVLDYSTKLVDLLIVWVLERTWSKETPN